MEAAGISATIWEWAALAGGAGTFGIVALLILKKAGILVKKIGPIDFDRRRIEANKILTDGKMDDPESQQWLREGSRHTALQKDLQRRIDLIALKKLLQDQMRETEKATEEAGIFMLGQWRKTLLDLGVTNPVEGEDYRVYKLVLEKEVIPGFNARLRIRWRDNGLPEKAANRQEWSDYIDAVLDQLFLFAIQMFAETVPFIQVTNAQMTASAVGDKPRYREMIANLCQKALEIETAYLKEIEDLERCSHETSRAYVLTGACPNEPTGCQED